MLENHIEGDVQKLVRIYEGDDAYELISTNESLESQSNHYKFILDASYETGDFAQNRIQLTDVNFDGKTDVLIDNGHFGNQGFITYACFLNNGDSFIKCDSFTEIFNPVVDYESEKVLSTWRNWSASHSFAMYQFQNNKYIRTDCITVEKVTKPQDAKLL